MAQTLDAECPVERMSVPCPGGPADRRLEGWSHHAVKSSRTSEIRPDGHRRRGAARAHRTGARLDDVRVWNRALSDEEPASGTSGAAPRGTVLWLPMDRVSGSN